MLTSANSSVIFTQYSHSDFDLILKSLLNEEKFSIKAVVTGNINNSDIKWNDMSGEFKIIVYDKTGAEFKILCGCKISSFTKNCGIKAIDHLYINSNNIDIAVYLLKILESFLFHRTNCGLVVGSDVNMTPSRYGGSLYNVITYGNGYIVTPPVWNPNYTWSHKHTISLFHKDLTVVEHQDFWNNP